MKDSVLFEFLKSLLTPWPEKCFLKYLGSHINISFIYQRNVFFSPFKNRQQKKKTHVITKEMPLNIALSLSVELF